MKLKQYSDIISWACWCDISEFCGANQSCTMWFTCDYHMILRYSQLLLLMRAVDALLCQYVVMTVTWQAASCAPKKCLMCTRPFPPLRVGSGMRLGLVHIEHMMGGVYVRSRIMYLPCACTNSYYDWEFGVRKWKYGDPSCYTGYVKRGQSCPRKNIQTIHYRLGWSGVQTW